MLIDDYIGKQIGTVTVRGVWGGVEMVMMIVMSERVCDCSG